MSIKLASIRLSSPFSEVSVVMGTKGVSRGVNKDCSSDNGILHCCMKLPLWFAVVIMEEIFFRFGSQ
ncbi:hypothetical protein EVA_01719 [gut metagenome]|uniref:Uncharacterized protein n=1 Tax=gut metagenome TaxID=749906 RepID=J9H7G4_9ZZZZ